MTDPVLESIEKERQVLRARLDVLDEMERKLKRAPRPNGVIVVQPHAPAGVLREAILKTLRSARLAQTSADIKRIIRSSGYKHPINGQYFTKTMRALVGERILSKTENGGYSTYQLKK